MQRLRVELRALIRQIHEDWCVHHRDWRLPGFRAVAVHRFGKWVSGAKKSPLRSALWIVHGIMYRYVRNHYGIELPVNTVVGRRFWIAHQSGIVIHPNAEIGDDCLIRQNVTIGAANFTRPGDAPKLGHRVQVGCGAVIVGKVKIGDGAFIGPNVVVMTNVPEGATVVAEAPRMIQVRKLQDDGNEGIEARPMLEKNTSQCQQ